ncbi:MULTISPECIES: aminotransferase class I/II-fold pyridoxal phosphate-dependent enzyme [unclassified Lebetimonas]|uniref:aminotransferase class I/II-fold pyridoxal phosphate-dependent enzyme n=2 Tax=Lebetimonas TaxID=267989 RepID=UPI000464C633|nr:MULTISPECIES: pyridoxal phosphate-dependent aminotransferase family protein [unclassified Lebetimonas]
MKSEKLYEKELNILKKKNRLRKRKIYDDNIIDLASNDYLGLAEKKDILDKAYEKAKEYHSHSAKASMLVNGYHPAHKILEEKLKELNNFEEAIIVGSGFLANMALFELGRGGDVFYVDEEYHASGIAGSRLTNAEVKFFKHNDFENLKKISVNYKKYNRVFTVVEGIYSMMGDKVKKEITDYAQKIGYLIIDEAHSVGICGDNLMGITDEYKLSPTNTIKMGTLGKALGSYGAYILANKEIIEFLLNKARSIIYTTALSPVDSLLAFYAIEDITNNLNFYKEKIKKRQKLFDSQSLIKIIPSLSNKDLLKKQKELLEKNILIGAIRPPTVKSPIFRIILRLNVSLDIIHETLNSLGEK